MLIGDSLLLGYDFLSLIIDPPKNLFARSDFCADVKIK
jgi:hypothetical protein